jgi:SAM-dependent methyltransferase
METAKSGAATATSASSEQSAIASDQKETRNDQLAALAHTSIYDTVLEILRNVPVIKILDVPAGEGALASRLLAAGYDVSCCDLYPEIFRLAGVDIRRGDLAARLPYEDGSFQAVVCVEGLEHTENPHHAVREFARLLKPGGTLIVSTPNILNIEERFKWLLYGYTSQFKPLSPEYLTKAVAPFGERHEITLHIHPIAYPELRYTLEKFGFQIVKHYRDKPKRYLWLYWPAVALVRLLGYFKSSSMKRERWTEELQSDEVLLGGNTLIVHAQKQ